MIHPRHATPRHATPRHATPRHAIASAVVGFSLLFTSFGCSNSAPATPPLGAPLSAIQQTPATCGGFGIAAPPASMNATENTLAVLISNYRISIKQLTGSQDKVIVGVARFHAADMAKNSHVGLVASDGEDVFRRITCSGGATGQLTGVIAVGYSTDAHAVFSAMMADFGALAILSNNTNNLDKSLSVGYSDGYWMIILQQ